MDRPELCLDHRLMGSATASLLAMGSRPLGGDATLAKIMTRVVKYTATNSAGSGSPSAAELN